MCMSGSTRSRLLLLIELLLQTGHGLFQLAQASRIRRGALLETGLFDGLLNRLAEQARVHLILAEVIKRSRLQRSDWQTLLPKGGEHDHGHGQATFEFF